MKPVHLMWLVAACGLLALFVPRDRSLTLSDQHAVTAAPTHVPAATIAWLGDDTVLDRQPDGHFYADAQVEGSPVHFLVDTGASVVALTAQDASAAGLEWNEDDLRYVARGASGPIMGVPARLDEISLGDFRAQNVDAVIIPRGLPVSLLGQSFLSQVPKLDIVGDRMTLAGDE